MLFIASVYEDLAEDRQRRTRRHYLLTGDAAPGGIIHAGAWKRGFGGDACGGTGTGRTPGASSRPAGASAGCCRCCGTSTADSGAVGSSTTRNATSSPNN